MTTITIPLWFFIFVVVPAALVYLLLFAVVIGIIVGLFFVKE